MKSQNPSSLTPRTLTWSPTGTAVTSLKDVLGPLRQKAFLINVMTGSPAGVGVNVLLTVVMVGAPVGTDVEVGVSLATRVILLSGVAVSGPMMIILTDAGLPHAPFVP